MVFTELILYFGIAYENDAEKAKQLIQKCLDEDKELIQDDQHTNFCG